MKASFALNLSHEGIGLLHRAKAGWLSIGEVALDDPELNEKLGYLRRTAAEMASGVLTTKLVIPNSQILYRQIPDPGPSEGERRRAVRAALDGATPYDLDDLIFDWQVDGDQLQIAVVARETLDEAEHFAADNKFNPISFVAIPEDGEFSGEPYFGPSRMAAKLLAKGDTVERDKGALNILAKAPEAEPEIQPEIAEPAELPEAQAQIDVPAEPETPLAAPETDLSDEAHVTDAPQPEASPEPVTEPDPGISFSSRRVSISDDAPEAADRLTAQPARFGLVAPADATPPPRSVPAMTDPGLPPDADEPPAKPAAPKVTLDAAIPDDVPPAPAINSAALKAEAAAPKTVQAPAPVAAPAPTEEKRRLKKPKGGILPEPPPMPAPPSAARRLAEPEPAPASSKKVADALPAKSPAKEAKAKPSNGKLAGKLTGKLSGKLTDGAKSAGKSAGDKIGDVTSKAKKFGTLLNGKKAAEAPGAAKPETPAAKPAAAKAAPPLPPFAKTAKKAPKGTVPSAPPELPEAVKRFNPVKTKRGTSTLPPPIPGTAPKGTAAEAEAMTVFGARRKTTARQRQNRYLGVILTGILLFFIAIAALLSTLLMGDSDATAPQNATVIEDPAPATANNDPQVAPTLAEIAGAAAPEASDTETVIDNPVPPADVALDTPEPTADDESASDGVDQAVAEADTPPIEAETSPLLRQMTETEAAAHYALTGVWPRSPVEPDAPQTSNADDIYIASIDVQIASQDAVALPVIEGAGYELPQVPALAAPPGTTFDFDENGLVKATPEGAMTPEGVMVFEGKPDVVPGLRPASIEALQEDSAVDPALQTGDEATTEVSRLATILPRLRPEGLIERNERATLGGYTRDQLAAITPRIRPLSPQEMAQAAAEAQGLLAPASTAPLIQVSAAPLLRPANMDAIVAAASVSGITNPDVVIEGTPDVLPASVAPAAAPSIPTTASVARQATVENAINLRQLNLIGVFGSDSDRHALIRTSTGRMVTVKVGDKLDGGQIIAIGTSDLTYVKGGRNYRLTISG